MSATGLAYWRQRFAAVGNLIEPLTGEVAARPGFSSAAYAHMRAAIALAASNPFASRISKDGTYQILGYLSLYLDAEDRLSNGAIHDLLSEFKLSSPGRATTILMYLLFSKLIAPDPRPRDRRTRRYVPTPAMKQAFIEIVADGQRAMAAVEPDIAACAERMNDPVYCKGFILAYGRTSLEMMNALIRKRTPRDMFADATRGYAMLIRVILGTTESAFPPRGPLHLSKTALATEFKVSRSHVRRMFDAAAARGLVVYGDDRSTIRIADPLAQHLTFLYASIFLTNIRCILAAVDYAAASTEAAA